MNERCRCGRIIETPHGTFGFEEDFCSSKCLSEALALEPWRMSSKTKREHESALKRQEGGDHYKNLPIQPIEYCQRNKLGFCESNVVKYVTRHRNKNGANDIKKAIHNLQLLLEMEYPNEKE